MLSSSSGGVKQAPKVNFGSVSDAFFWLIFSVPKPSLLAWSIFLLPNGTQYQAKYSQAYLMMNPPLWRVKGAPRASLTIFKVCSDFQPLSGVFYQAPDIKVRLKMAFSSI